MRTAASRLACRGSGASRPAGIRRSRVAGRLRCVREGRGQGCQRRVGDGAVAGVVATGICPVRRERRHRLSLCAQPQVSRDGWRGLAVHWSTAAGCAEQRQPLGQIGGDSCSVARVFACLVWGVGVDLVEQGAPQGTAWAGAISAVMRFPVDQQAAAGGRRKRTARPGGARRHNGGPAAALSPRPPRSDRDGWPAFCTRVRRGCSRSPRAAARPWRPATTDRRRWCR